MRLNQRAIGTLLLGAGLLITGCHSRFDDDPVDGGAVAGADGGVLPASDAGAQVCFPLQVLQPAGTQLGQSCIAELSHAVITCPQGYFSSNDLSRTVVQPYGVTPQWIVDDCRGNRVAVCISFQTHQCQAP